MSDIVHYHNEKEGQYFSFPVIDKERYISALSGKQSGMREKYMPRAHDPIGGTFGALTKIDHFGVEDQFGETVFKRIVTPGDKIVALTGEPGIGKTTNAVQLAQRLKKEGKRVVVVSFDEIKDAQEKDLGVECAQWNHKQWDIFSTKLADATLHPEVSPPRRRGRKTDTVVIVDAVALGKRGGKLMELLAEKSATSPDAVTVLRFASIEPMQIESGMQREKIASASDEQAPNIFATLYNTIFEFADVKISNTQLGKIIKERVGKSATLKAITKIIKETRDYIRDFLKEIPYKVINAIELPHSLLEYAVDVQHRIKRNIFAWLEYFSSLGFSDESAYVVVNQKKRKQQGTHALQAL